MENSRKIVCGVGINDADYAVHKTVDGKRVVCPFYKKWRNILTRSYNQKWRANNPTYISVTVCDEWKTFSNFRKWMVTQPWQGNQLDKDLIKPGNTEYGPENCCFVGQPLNLLLTDHAAKRGKWPIGVYYNKPLKKYLSRCHDGTGKLKHLGIFGTPSAAHAAYVRFKSNLIASIACQQSDRRISNGLMCHAALVSMKA